MTPLQVQLLDYLCEQDFSDEAFLLIADAFEEFEDGWFAQLCRARGWGQPTTNILEKVAHKWAIPVTNEYGDCFAYNRTRKYWYKPYFTYRDELQSVVFRNSRRMWTFTITEHEWFESVSRIVFVSPNDIPSHWKVIVAKEVVRCRKKHSS